MNEPETRAEHIDPAFRAAGWGGIEGSRVMREYRITEGRLQGAGQRAKPEIADYVLVYRNHKLAVIEAKRLSAAYTEGLAQAKQYAAKIGARFTYATNGVRIYGVDMQSGVEGDVDVYPSPEELWDLTFAEANDWCERFAAVPFEDKGGMWGSPFVCIREPLPPCYVCGKKPCECEKPPCPKCGQRPCVCKNVRVKLRDGKERTIQHITVTTFWVPDGKPISAAEFLTLLFGQLPEFFKDEDELRALWSLPDTRKKLLEGLAEKGFGKDQISEMQKIIDAENSDLFDVLAHVAFAMQPITRKERAASAHKEIHDHFSDKQQVFLGFVLAHYVHEGVEELDQETLTKLLCLKYLDSIPDAVTDLGGDIHFIRNMFSNFQQYLYQQSGS